MLHCLLHSFVLEFGMHLAGDFVRVVLWLGERSLAPSWRFYKRVEGACARALSDVEGSTIAVGLRIGICPPHVLGP